MFGSGGRGGVVRLIKLSRRALGLAGHPRAEARGDQSGRAARARRAAGSQLEEGGRVVARGEVLATDVPVHPEVARHLEPLLERLVVARACRSEERVECCLEVVVLEDASLHRRDLRRALDAVADLLRDRGVAARVAGGDVGGGARLLELLAGIVGDRLEHPQAAVRLDDERGVDERLELVERPLPRDRLGVGERAPAREDGEAPERLLRGLVEERVAPVDRRAERLLALRAVARARGEELERVVEAVAQSFRSEQADARSGELEREWESVEAPADLRDRFGVILTTEARARRLGAGREERDGIGCGQRLDGIEALSGDAERNATRDEKLEPRAAGDQRGHVGRGVDDLLEVVEDEEHAPIADERGDAVDDRALLGLLDVERGSECGKEVGGVGDVREADERGAVGKLRRQAMRELDREAGLPHAPRARHRHDPVRAHELGKVGELALAAEQFRARLRQRCAERRSDAEAPDRREVALAELVEPDGLGHVLEAVLSEVAEVAVDELASRAGDEHLSAMPGGHDPRGEMDVHADVLRRVECRLAGVHAHADLDRSRLECLHRFRDGVDRVRGRLEDVEERVSFVVDLVPGVPRERLPHDPAVPVERFEVRLLLELVEQARRTLDISEDQGDRAGRLLATAHLREYRLSRDG